MENLKRQQQQQMTQVLDQTKPEDTSASVFDMFDFARGGMSDRQMFLLFVVFGPALVFGFVVVMNQQWREQVFGNQTQQALEKKKRMEMLDQKRAKENLQHLVECENPLSAPSQATPPASGSSWIPTSTHDPKLCVLRTMYHKMESTVDDDDDDDDDDAQLLD